MIIDNLYTSHKLYNIILSNPPWEQKKSGYRKVRPNENSLYSKQIMKLDDIILFHKDILPKYSDFNHNVFIWTIDKHLFDTERFMYDMGYMLHCRIIWNKLNGIAPAFTVRFSHEYLLWFYKKNRMYKVAKDMSGKYTTVLTEKSYGFTIKPECSYNMLDNMFPDANKLELFANNPRDGWDSYFYQD